MLSLFIFYAVALIFLTYFGYPFFWSIFVAEAIAGSIALLLSGQLLAAVLHFIVWSIALSVYEDGRQLDVKFKFWFALVSFFFPIIGVPAYLLLRKKNE